MPSTEILAQQDAEPNNVNVFWDSEGQEIRRINRIDALCGSWPDQGNLIGAPDKNSGKRRQSIHICYDLIGFSPLSELMEQEMA